MKIKLHPIYGVKDMPARPSFAHKEVIGYIVTIGDNIKSVLGVVREEKGLWISEHEEHDTSVNKGSEFKFNKVVLTASTKEDLVLKMLKPLLSSLKTIKEQIETEIEESSTDNVEDSSCPFCGEFTVNSIGECSSCIERGKK